MLEIWAFRPDCRSGPASVHYRVSPLLGSHACDVGFTHNEYRSRHDCVSVLKGLRVDCVEGNELDASLQTMKNHDQHESTRLLSWYILL